jgi:peptidyl-prolyl cis-trans isomerase C
MRTLYACVVGAVLLCWAGAPAAVAAEEQKAGKMLATVGKEKITQADLDAKITMLPPQFRERYETPEGKQKLLDQVVKFSLLSQEARALGIHKREDVAQRIKEITDNIIIQELTKQEVTDKIAASDAEIQKYYNENKQEFVKPEKIKANLIMFEVKADATPEQKKAIENKAKEALKRLKKGEDFAKLAGELSEDKRTNKRGGDTGFFSRGRRANTYGEVFEQKAFALKAGELSDVFEDKGGFFIVKVVEKKAEEAQSLEESKKKIERQLTQDKQKQQYDAFVESLKKKYPIKMAE